MHRFFVSPKELQKETVILSGDDANHIITVLRLRPGEKIILCNTLGVDYLCEIDEIRQKQVSVHILSQKENTAEPKCLVSLYQGLPKFDKMELIIQKCVELGVCQIVPVMTERTVVKIKKDTQNKITRWQKIALSGAKQSGRGIIPQIGEFTDFKDAVEKSKESALSIMPYELEEKRFLKELLTGRKLSRVAVFIGPEGGFSQGEVDYAISQGIVPVSLGRRILRTETAGFVALSLIMYETGEL